MKIVCVDVVSSRSDNIPGMPTGLTVGKVYDVAEILEDKFSIINDSMKMARYSKFRFAVVEDSPVKPLRDNFNTLTTCMRSRIKELEAQVAALS